MQTERVDEGYLKEWEKQFGVKVTPPDDDEEVSEEVSNEEEEIKEEVEQEEPEKEESPESESQEEESSTDEQEERPAKEAKPAEKQEFKSKDDEYRAFIESQPTEELKERARHLVQGLKSADGRTSALHRQLNAREQLIQQLYQKGTSAKEPQAPASSRQDGSAQKTSDQLPEKVKALKQKNPEAAEIIEEIAKYQSNLTLKQMQELIDKRLGSIEQEREGNKRTEEWNKVEQKAEQLFGQYNLTAADIVRSEDFQAWLELKRVEEPGIYNLYATASDADTAYLILEKYEQEYQKALKEAGVDQGTEEESHKKGDEIRSRRQKAKESNTGVKPSRAGTPTQDTSNLSYEEEWNLLWGPNGKLTKQRRR